jgi:hypothetical protein
MSGVKSWRSNKEKAEQTENSTILQTAEEVRTEKILLLRWEKDR